MSAEPSRPDLFHRPTFWLAVMVIAFFAISSYAGFASYANLETQNSTDAGIVTQAVASEAHGHVPPFYESYDCMVKFRCSFLLVHPAFVLFAAVPVYDLAPSTLTLFVLRSALVALTAVPLFLLTRRLTGSSGKALLAAGLFLLWAPSFVGDAFSLHMETLLPLELISLVLLWEVGRYRLGFLVAALTCATFEVYPLFTFLVGVFFLVPYVETGFARLRDGWRAGRHSSRSPTWRTTARRLVVDGWRIPRFRNSVLLVVGSAVAYVLVSVFMNAVGSALLGVAAPPVQAGLGGLFANNSSPAAQSVGVILSSAQTVRTAEYWLILYALAGFLPLLAPRTLVLSVPWIGWTFLTDSSRFTTLGHQYTMIGAAPIFLGVAYGLVRLPWSRRSPAAATGPDRRSGRRDALRRRWRWARSGRAQRTAGTVALGVLIGANILLLPIVPVLPDLGARLGPVFMPAYFDHALTIPTWYAAEEHLVALIPYSDSVLVPSLLYALVANWPHAYILVAASERNVQNLPFNVSAGPDYVLVPPGSFSDLGVPTATNVSDPAVYGLRGYVGSTRIGPLLLYEKSFRGVAQEFGPGLAPIDTTYLPYAGLRPGPIGRFVPNSTAPSGVAIASLNGTNHSGVVWSGPQEFLPPGNYTVTFQVSASGTNFSKTPTSNVLRLMVIGFGGDPLSVNLTAAELAPGAWTNLTFGFTSPDPLPDFELEGVLEDVHCAVAVGAVTLVPESA